MGLRDRAKAGLVKRLMADRIYEPLALLFAEASYPSTPPRPGMPRPIVSPSEAGRIIDQAIVQSQNDNWQMLARLEDPESAAEQGHRRWRNACTGPPLVRSRKWRSGPGLPTYWVWTSQSGRRGRPLVKLRHGLHRHPNLVGTQTPQLPACDGGTAASGRRTSDLTARAFASTEGA